MNRIKNQALALVVILAAVLVLAEAWGQWLPFPQKGARRGETRIFHLGEIEQGIYRLTNEVRRKNRLSSLDKDEALAAAARAHSDDMLRRNFFGHVNPDGQSMKERLPPVAAATVSRAGENIWSGSGQDYTDSKRLVQIIVDSWMSSPAHRANLLNPEYTHLGVGVSLLGKEIRATQLFTDAKSQR
jgi:uncharacterized protein YkwD